MTFSLGVKEFAEATGRNAQDVLNSVSIDLFSRIVLETPVDEGTLRGHWIPSKESPNYKGQGKVDRSGSSVIAEIASTFEPSQSQKHYITNNLPYARIVEYGLYPNPPKNPTGKTINGFSKLADKGMVRVNIKRFDQAIQKAIAKAKS